MMIMIVMYQLFRWTPPELSLSEKIWLGKEILKVGPDVFAAALKKRLAAPSTKEKLLRKWLNRDEKDPPYQCRCAVPGNGDSARANTTFIICRKAVRTCESPARSSQ